MNRSFKKWLAAFMAAAMCIGIAFMTMPTLVLAAEGTKTVVTIQHCSIWSAPATEGENRVRYVDEGYQITVYPEVVESTLGDGKTFYRTVKGAYVLCKCVADVSENEAGTASEVGTAGGNWAASASEVKPPAVDVVSAYSERSYWPSGDYYIKEYDEFGNMIRYTSYNADGSPGAHSDLIDVSVYEYDSAGNQIKAGTYSYYQDGTFRSLQWFYYEDFNEYGVAAKRTVYHNNEICYVDIYEEYNEAIAEYMQVTCYYPDGCYGVGRRFVQRVEGGYSFSALFAPQKYYNPDGSSMSEWHRMEHEMGAV